jgi:Flp pilus assembly protein TadG
MSTRLKCLRRDERGNIAILAALISPILIGFLGLALETAWWYQEQRDLQSAADEAAIAAATNASSSYTSEALATTANYGYANGQNNVTVTATNSASCPVGGSNCYSVTISLKQQLYLMSVVGFTGDTTVNGSPAQTLTATATAAQGTVPRQYCLLALDTKPGDDGIHFNGGPKVDFSGCNIKSDTNATCHGHNTNADIGDASGTNNNCGVIANSNTPVLADPYAKLAANVPANPCKLYPQEGGGKHGGAGLPASNQLSGGYTWSGNTFMCGDIQLTGDTTINGNVVLVIENGRLDTNGYTLSTAAGSSITIMFSGDNSGSYTHAPTGGGTLNIQAPSSGPWSGVALYQDPGLISGIDISSAGNSPTWDITGLVYLPRSNITFSGAVNKSNNGAACFALVANSVLINGTGYIFEHGGCAAAGLNMPTGQVPGRGRLVT